MAFRLSSSASLFVSSRIFRPLWTLAGMAALSFAVPALSAQSIIPLPNTVTTVAGGGATSTGTSTTPVACYTGSLLKSFDAYGNGCTGPYVNFSSDLRGGVASDGAGNIYIGDTSNNMVRMYDPRTGIVSRVAGKGTNCGAGSGQQDSSGDGCLALQTSLASTPRGIGTDPYGNVLFAGYGTQMVHVVCKAASPLCPGTTGRKQIGSMYRVAGCVATALATATAGSAGNTTIPLNTWAGTEGDNSFASPFNNLAGDASALTTGIAGNGTCPGANVSTASTGMLNQPRGVAADRFGNVYIGETGATGAGLRFRVVLGPQTSTYFSGSNPMWAILNGKSFTSTAGSFTYTAHEGYIYTILGGFSGAPAKGAACFAGSSSIAENAVGDGCPFFYSSANGGQQGVAVDDYGNVFFSDTANSSLRVLYAGGAGNPLGNAISANSGGTVTAAAVVPGNVYLLAGGGGSTTPTTSPMLGTTLNIQNSVFKLAIGPKGNLYMGDSGASQGLFYDVSTGYLKVLFKTATACAAHIGASTNGEGCPAGGFSFSASNGFGVAVDPIGNVYFSDSTNALIRKVEATSLVPITLGATRADSSANTQTFLFHGAPGIASMTFTALDSAQDLVLGTPTCSALFADNSIDCSLPITFTPAQPGPRGLHLAVKGLDATSTVISSVVVPINGVAYGTALVTDVPNPATEGATGILPRYAAVDASDNFYTANVSDGVLLKVPITTGNPTPIGTLPASFSGIAADTAGNIFVLSPDSGNATRYTLNADGTYSTGVQTVPGVTAPKAVAIDAVGNAYIIDSATSTLYLYPVHSDFSTQQPLASIAVGFTSPLAVALDGQGNIFVADATGISKIANVNGAFTKTLYIGTGGTIPTAINPTALAADAAGNVYVQDALTKSLLMFPVNQTGSASVTVLSGLTSPTGVAVDGTGKVYSVDSTAITLVKRANVATGFQDTSYLFTGTITNTGNLTATGYQSVGLDLGDFPVTSVSPSNCFNAAAILPGYACSITSQFTPGPGSGNVSSTIAYAPVASTIGSLQFTATKTGTAITSTTTIGTPSTASPIYAATGTEVSFPVTVAASDSSTPSGSVTVSIDSGTPVGYTLVGGAVTVNVSGLSAGNHTIVAAYATQGGLTGSTSSTVNFTIGQASTQVNWTPGAATTQPYSSAVGNSILDASAVVTGTSVAVPGYYQYKASLKPSGVPFNIHAASYLPIGSYTLLVTFTPYDTVNYTVSTASVTTYTVTKADTSAGLGSTQMLVAADGTGNFTSIQAAVNATPANGGSIYIKPGTYTENVAVVQPNVSLRGLGGDPTKVVLTHQAGAFGGSGVYQYAGEFTTAQTNGYQLPAGSTLFNGDEGSATLVVAKGINTAVSSSTLIPNGFYAENLSLINTYNSDTTKTTSTYLPSSNSGTCTAGQGPARTFNDLFNAGQLCASQALSIWITSDLAVMNNIYSTSLQDTIYAGSQGSGSNGYVPARQYWFRGKVTGTVDYIFGDAAAVFDYSSIYTVPHGTGITGSATIEAQNKAVQTGSTGDYLSGYIMNSNVFTSYQNGQTGLYFGRPYGQYSTWIMLNSYVDQVNPLGYFEFSSGTNNLPTSTYAEYNNLVYTDPATGAADLNGVAYLGVGGASGAGVTGTRETVSQNPGTLLASNSPKTTMSAQQATLYYPQAFLGGNVSNTVSSTQNWNVTSAMAAAANAFVPSTNVLSPAYGAPITLLMRPQTAGLGAVTNGQYTIPTGTYSLLDNGSLIAFGSLDASGQVTYTSSTLAPGQHSFTWTYSGDSNFNGSSTTTPLVITVGQVASTTVLAPLMQTVTYGQSAVVTASVTAPGYSPTGTASLYLDGSLIQTLPLSSGSVQFTVTGVTAGTHNLVANYNGDTKAMGSASPAVKLIVNQATLTITATGTDRVFGSPNILGHNTGGYQNGDTAGNVFTSGPSQTTAATRLSPVGSYTVTPVYTLSAYGAANYTVNAVNGSFNVTGGAVQSIFFPTLPNFTAGSYQLTARATSGLPVTYSLSAGNGIASINGTTLTVTGTGLVTVVATQTDASGNYATTSSSRSFNAQ